MMSDDDLPTEPLPPINTDALTEASTFAEIDAAMGVEPEIDTGEFHMRSIISLPSRDASRGGPRSKKWR